MPANFASRIKVQQLAAEICALHAELGHDSDGFKFTLAPKNLIMRTGAGWKLYPTGTGIHPDLAEYHGPMSYGYLAADMTSADFLDLANDLIREAKGELPGI